MASAARRVELVDALRAFALAGILQVNIQSFLWGAGDPLGYFLTAPSALDRAVHWLVGTFISVKFISIFAFLFGVGAAFQWRKLRRQYGNAGAAQLHYQRRLRFLLAIGVAHGTLLYFGDILGFYALCGFVLLHYIDARPAQLVRALRHWWIAFAVLTVVVWLANALGRALVPAGPAPGEIPLATLQRFGVYGGGSYVQQLGPRLGDYVSVQVSLLVASVPQVVGLFLLGLLAGRQGWLMHPDRHPRIWRAAVRIGLAALPVAALGAWVSQQSVLSAPGDPGFGGYFLQLVGSATACLYVTLFVRWRAHAVMQRVMHWLAPAGRMPLTNYLLQSVLMGALLSGWGVGLGPVMSHAELAVVALAIVVLQWFASRAWMARFDQGPVEALWRRATYG